MGDIGPSINERLNPGSGSDAPRISGGDGFTVEPGVLKQIAEAAGDIQERTLKDGVHAEDYTNAAAAALKGENFDLGGALEKAFRTWQSQIDTLAQACAHIEGSLAAAAGEYEKTDAETELSMAEISEYFE